jgi:protocatechuate 4,5-dioxygenase beta chain
MAHLVGAIATSHIPSIGKALARKLQDDPQWKPFFDGYKPVYSWLDRVRPDVAVVIYNDHGLNFFLDKMPTFAIGAAPEYRNADEGWGLQVVPAFPGDPRFSWHLIGSLVYDEFDVTTCQEMLVDHGFVVPMGLLWGQSRAIRTIPIAINTVQLPLPTAARCYKLGKAIGKAIESYDKDLRVVVLGTGGLSHQLDGERAGFINRKFDLECLESIVNDPEALTRYSTLDLIRLSGAQGVELLMWLVMRGALTDEVRKIHCNYHVPLSNTASAVLVLEGIENGVTAWLDN